MTNAGADKITLAIESAVEGGSLSLLRGGSEIGSRVGNSGLSRAEDLLIEIRDLLTANGLAPRDLQIVAASAGPGSFTGLRIGLATALGLARGSGAKFASVSLLYACANLYLTEGNGTVVVPTGRGSVAVQDFTQQSDGVSAISQPQIISADSLADLRGREDGSLLLLHYSLVERVNPTADDVKKIGPNLAHSIGVACAANPIVTEPLFLSKA